MASKRLLTSPLTRSLPSLTRPLTLPTRLQKPRSYHSHDHPAPPPPFTPLETSILTSSYPHIPTHGFTPTTLALGASKAGYAPAAVNIFPRGALSLVAWHMEVQKGNLAGLELFKDDMASGNVGKKRGVGETVKELTWQRLLGNREVIGRWQEALALLALPSNIPTALHHLASLSDEIWYLAGDTSVDTSWYTKRASLSAIYAATELFMTTDKSEGFRDTKEFMERRFRDGQVVGGAVGSLGEWIGFTARAGVNVLRSRGVRI